MNNVCISSRDQVTHGIAVIHCSSNYNKSAIWDDTDIRLIVKTTAQSVIWVDIDIRLIVKTTAQSVIWDDTYIRLIVKITVHRVWYGMIFIYTPHSDNQSECDMGWYLYIPQALIVKTTAHGMYTSQRVWEMGKRLGPPHGSPPMAAGCWFVWLGHQSQRGQLWLD